MFPPLKVALIEWFEAHRESATALADHASLPTTAVVERRRVVPSGNGWSLETERVPVSPVRFHQFHDDYARHVASATEFAGSREVAEALVASVGFPDRLKLTMKPASLRQYGSSAPDVDFSDDPQTWLLQNVVEPAGLSYLARLTDLRAPNAALAEQVATEVLDFVATGEVELEAGLVVGNITTASDATLEADGLILRPLTAEERGLFVGELGLLNDEYASVPPPRSFGFSEPPTCALIDRSRGTLEDFRLSTIRDRLDPLLLALELKGETPVKAEGWCWSRIASPAWLGGGRRGRPSPDLYENEFHHGSSSTPVTQKLFDEVVQLHNHIDATELKRPTTSEYLALDRFVSGTARGRPADALIDYCVALEATLVRQEQELSFRFKYFGAAFLASSADDIEALAAQFGNTYKVRSQLVHGSKKATSVDLKSAAAEARELAARVLVKCLENGWPSETELQAKLLLGPSSTASCPNTPSTTLEASPIAG